MAADEFDLDLEGHGSNNLATGELDELGEFGDFDDFGIEEPVDDRTPALKVGNSFVEGVRETATDPEVMRRSVKRALPEGYKGAVDLAETAVDTADEIYSEAQKRLEPTLRQTKKATKKVLRRTKKILPETVYDKLDKWADDEERAGAERVNQDEFQIQSSIAQIFQIQNEQEKAKAEEATAQRTIDSQVSAKRYDATTSQIEGIQKALHRLVSYQDRVTAEYQKKSLELQFRHYFIARDQFELFKRYTADDETHQKAIVKNTGLPDWVKTRDMENLRQELQQRLFGKGLDTFSSFTSNYVQGFTQNIKEFALGKVDEIADGMEMLSDMVEQLDMMMENEDGMSDEPAQITKTKIAQWAAKTGAGKATEKLMQKAGKVIVGRMERDGIITSSKNKDLLYTVRNLPKLGNMIAKGTITPDSVDLGSLNFMKGFLFENIERFSPKMGGEREGITRQLQENATEHVQWDMLSRTTLVEIIPGYLSRMTLHLENLDDRTLAQELTAKGIPAYRLESELTKEKTKLRDQKQLVYDISKEEFGTRAKTVERTRQDILTYGEANEVASELDKTIDYILKKAPKGDDKKPVTLSEEAIKTLRYQLVRDVDAVNTFDTENYAKADYYLDPNADVDTKKELSTFFSYMLKEERGSKDKYQTTNRQYKSVRNKIADRMGGIQKKMVEPSEIQQRLNLYSALGQKDLLRDAGWIDKSGKFNSKRRWEMYVKKGIDSEQLKIEEERLKAARGGGAPAEFKMFGSTKLQMPVNGDQTSDFGKRQSPFGQSSEHHDGIDIATPSGTPIKAAGRGRIAQIGEDDTYGTYVVIQHAKQVFSHYGHLSSVPDDLEIGQDVKQGQIIAYSGDSGRSTGPHLHFAVRTGPSPTDPAIDPEKAVGRDVKHISKEIVEAQTMGPMPASEAFMGPLPPDRQQKSQMRKEQKADKRRLDEQARRAERKDFSTMSVKDLLTEQLHVLMDIREFSGGSIAMAAGGMAMQSGEEMLRKLKDMGLFRGQGWWSSVFKTGSKIVSAAGEAYADYFSATAKGITGAMEGASKVGRQAIDWLVQKKGEGDVYIKGMKEPILTVQQVQSGMFRDQSTGKRIYAFSDITGPVMDMMGNLVITAQMLADGQLYTFDGEPSVLQKVGDGIFKFGKSTAEKVANFYGGLFDIGSGAKQFAVDTIKQIDRKLKTKKDIYLKNDRTRPVLTRFTMVNGGYHLGSSDGPVISSVDDITGDVYDSEGLVLRLKDIEEHGICDREGNEIKVGGLGKTIAGLAGKAIAAGIKYTTTGFQWLTDYYRTAGEAAGNLLESFKNMVQFGGIANIDQMAVNARSVIVYAGGDPSKDPIFQKAAEGESPKATRTRDEDGHLIEVPVSPNAAESTKLAIASEKAIAKAQAAADSGDLNDLKGAMKELNTLVGDSLPKGTQKVIGKLNEKRKMLEGKAKDIKGSVQENLKRVSGSARLALTDIDTYVDRNVIESIRGRYDRPTYHRYLEIMESVIAAGIQAGDNKASIKKSTQAQTAEFLKAHESVKGRKAPQRDVFEISTASKADTPIPQDVLSDTLVEDQRVPTASSTKAKKEGGNWVTRLIGAVEGVGKTIEDTSGIKDTGLENVKRDNAGEVTIDPKIKGVKPIKAGTGSQTALLTLLNQNMMRLIGRGDGKGGIGTGEDDVSALSKLAGALGLGGGDSPLDDIMDLFERDTGGVDEQGRRRGGDRRTRRRGRTRGPRRGGIKGLYDKLKYGAGYAKDTLLDVADKAAGKSKLSKALWGTTKFLGRTAKGASKLALKTGLGTSKLALKAGMGLGRLGLGLAFGGPIRAAVSTAALGAWYFSDDIDEIASGVFSKMSKVEPIERTRFVMYGINPDDKDQVSAIRFLERKAEDHISINLDDGSVREIFDTHKEQDDFYLRHMKLFGVDVSDIDTSKPMPQDMINWLSWYRFRFLELWSRCKMVMQRGLKAIDRDIHGVDLRDIDDEMPSKIKVPYLDAVKLTKDDTRYNSTDPDDVNDPNVTVHPYYAPDSPFPGYTLTLGMGPVDAAIEAAKEAIEGKDKQKDKRRPSYKPAVPQDVAFAAHAQIQRKERQKAGNRAKQIDTLNAPTSRIADKAGDKSATKLDRAAAARSMYGTDITLAAVSDTVSEQRKNTKKELEKQRKQKDPVKVDVKVDDKGRLPKDLLEIDTVLPIELYLMRLYGLDRHGVTKAQYTIIKALHQYLSDHYDLAATKVTSDATSVYNDVIMNIKTTDIARQSAIKFIKHVLMPYYDEYLFVLMYVNELPGDALLDSTLQIQLIQALDNVQLTDDAALHHLFKTHTNGSPLPNKEEIVELAVNYDFDQGFIGAAKGTSFSTTSAYMSYLSKQHGLTQLSSPMKYGSYLTGNYSQNVVPIRIPANQKQPVGEGMRYVLKSPSNKDRGALLDYSAAGVTGSGKTDSPASKVDTGKEHVTPNHASSGAYVMPCEGRISSPFGMRTDPITGERKGHSGVDIAVPTGTPVYATANGIVSRRYTSTSYGNTVIIDHDDGKQSLYAHMHGFDPNVSQGDRVTMGQRIGFVGSTGRSTGPHLHFEIRNEPNNKKSAVDPLKVVKANSAIERLRREMRELAQEEKEAQQQKTQGDTVLEGEYTLASSVQDDVPAQEVPTEDVQGGTTPPANTPASVPSAELVEAEQQGIGPVYMPQAAMAKLDKIKVERMIAQQDAIAQQQLQAWHELQAVLSQSLETQRGIESVLKHIAQSVVDIKEKGSQTTSTPTQTIVNTSPPNTPKPRVVPIRNKKTL